jgi:hypothetical protein
VAVYFRDATLFPSSDLGFDGKVFIEKQLLQYEAQIGVATPIPLNEQTISFRFQIV